MTRIVLAHSGGVATSVAIRWLAERYGAEVVVLTIDLGQGGELTDIRERALAAGAVRAHVLDAREELLRDYVTPALQAGVLSAGRGPLATPLGRALIAKRLVDLARMESASAVAHASPEAPEVPGTIPGKVPGTNGTKVVPTVLDEAMRVLDPALTVIAPARLWGMSRAQQLEYARDRGVPISPDVDTVDVDANVWGRSIRSASMDDPGADLFDRFYTLTRAATDCPDEPAFLDIEFERGVPVRANGIEMPFLELIESLDIIAGAHGVGRIPLTRNSGMLGRAAFEAPAAVLLHAAHRELEAHALPDDYNRVKEGLARKYATLVEAGGWFSATREGLDAFVRAAQPRVNGSVRLKLFKGDCQVVDRRVASASAPREAPMPLDYVAAEGLIS